MNKQVLKGIEVILDDLQNDLEPERCNYCKIYSEVIDDLRQKLREKWAERIKKIKTKKKRQEEKDETTKQR